MFGRNFSYFSLYLLPLLLSLGITCEWYCLCEYSFHLPVRCFYTLIWFALSFLQAELFYFCPSIFRPESSALIKLSSCCSSSRRCRAGPSTPDASLVLAGKAGFTCCSPGCCCPCGARACCCPILQICQKWFSPSIWTTYCSAFVTSTLPTPSANLNQSDSTGAISGLFPTAPPALAVAFVGVLVSWLSLEESSLNIFKEDWTLSHSSFCPLEAFPPTFAD